MKIIYSENYDQQIQEINDYNETVKKYNLLIDKRLCRLAIIKLIVQLFIMMIVLIVPYFFLDNDVEAFNAAWAASTFYDKIVNIFLFLLGASLAYVLMLVLPKYIFRIIANIYGKKQEPKNYSKQQKLYMEIKPIINKSISSCWTTYDKLHYSYIDKEGNVHKEKIELEGMQVIENININDFEINIDELIIKEPAKISSMPKQKVYKDYPN
ncbi:hypothetical protein Ami103574_10915 [Aminipila butyrica]|uniref:Uncharacterized protein n=1 Tax=Aminipila butyrica TaxID=433296 RepID=A0A858BY14_9FIRM|nr:hypothetical protein [Aminipila butyrica]QIB69800.1 hypothetical protein Ami103574_10915 [Aminipila butyrica]